MEEEEDSTVADAVSWSCAEDDEEEEDPFACSTDDAADDEEWNFVLDW